MADIDLLHHELPIVEQLVREAGELVRSYYDNGAAVAWKGADDPVTAADHAANQHLVAGLGRAFPSDGILSEESHDNRARLARRRVWIVDPLDGTKEFIGRIGEFSIMVGLAIEGEAVLGVVYQPVADLLYRGAPGLLAELAQGGSVSRWLYQAWPIQRRCVWWPAARTATPWWTPFAVSLALSTTGPAAASVLRSACWPAASATCTSTRRPA